MGILISTEIGNYALTLTYIMLVSYFSPLSKIIHLNRFLFVGGTYGKVFLLNENFQEIKRVKTGGYSHCALNH